jgi:RNA polymerase sigma-70 factor, ECF subfamily
MQGLQHGEMPILPSMPDSADRLQDLIAATARSDQPSFARLYQRTHTHLFGLALRMLGTRHAAEDVLQEAFVSIWKSAHTYLASADQHDSHAMAWLIAVLRNKALDALRSRTRLKEDTLPEDDGLEEDNSSPTPPTSISALEQLNQAAQALQIQDCMAALGGSYRQSLALAYYQGLSHSEVAQQMGAPLGSVKAWIRRGLEQLKSCLGAA